MLYGRNRTRDPGRNAWRESPQKKRNALKTAILTKKSKIFIKATLKVSKSYLLELLGFMIFCILRDAHINHKISFNLSVQVAILLVFDNQSIMLFHIFISVLDHELILDNFLIKNSVNPYLAKKIWQLHQKS